MVFLKRGVSLVLVHLVLSQKPKILTERTMINIIIYIFQNINLHDPIIN